ncbi:Hypothetical protein D9617_17g047000 [Elsinoe fawcettii]|nr:Hypothetical protein D9617_17g047000 [Elsinoe fawcettii]
MCKHLAECPAVRSHLDYQANGFNAAENSSLRPRRHTEAQVQRRRLAPQPQPPVIPNLVTQMPRYSQQLSPDDARQMWQAQSWMDIGNIRNARSAPVSHVDPMESRQGSNMPFSQALVDGGDQDMMETTPFGTSNNTVVPHNDDFPAYSYDALNQGQTPASLFGQIHPGINDPTDPSIDLDALMREMQQPPPPEDFYY